MSRRHHVLGNGAAPLYGGGGGGFGGHEQLEEQNNAAEDELKNKVSALRELTIDIGHEVREHNRLLNEADDAFDSVGGILGNTIGKVRKLAKSGYKFYFLYIFIFALFVFVILWLYI